MRTFLERALWLADLTRGTGAQLAINGRLDVALLVDAHLHLPVGGPRPADVRPHLPPERWISAAVHSSAEVEAARGADALLVSPVHPPGSKPHDTRAPLGPEGFERLARAAAPTPCFALGGMSAARVRELPLLAGIAVQSVVLRTPDPVASARALLEALG